MKKIFLLSICFLAFSLFSMESDEAFLTCENKVKESVINDRITRWSMLPPSGKLTFEQLKVVKELTQNALERNDRYALNDVRRRFPTIPFKFICATGLFVSEIGTKDNQKYSLNELHFARTANPLPSWNEHPEDIYKKIEITTEFDDKPELKASQNDSFPFIHHYLDNGGIVCILQ